jgi:hypothetical protein
VVNAIRTKLGLDGAVAYTLFARLVGIMGSTGMVLLIVHFLSPIEQGYYYTLLSLASLQMVFELGFSFVIQQLAAHECIRLELHPDGNVTGNPAAHARLASTLQLSLKWYTVAAGAMALILAPMGMVFFNHHAVAGSVYVAWQGPWLMAVLASSVSLWCMPFYSFLEGCGYVRKVAALRLRQAIATAIFAWVPMLLHVGLYSPAMAIMGYICAGAIFLGEHRRLLMGLMHYPVDGNAVHWKSEVWPFQWRIAISWMCSYFTVQAFIPILFALRGATEAGQMGMSLSITGYMTSLVLPWISTKATPFGRLIADHRFLDLDRLFHRALRQALAIFGMVALCVCGGAAMLPVIAPRLAARIVSPRLFVVLVLAAGANCIIQSLAVLLRSFKKEPFLVQSLLVASLTLVLGALAAPRWGSAGAAFSYLIASTGFALPSAYVIFARARHKYLASPHLALLQSEVR